MTKAIDALLPAVAELAPERLNQSCLCITLDRDELALQLDREAGELDTRKNRVDEPGDAVMAG